MWWNSRPYVSAAQRRAKADRTVKQLAKKGRVMSPVKIAGRQIAATFWGRAWCDNLESYSDLSNRLPRGRTYARNGSVIDLQIEPGGVTAMVSGSDLYNIRIELAPLAKSAWKEVKSQCAGRIGSLVDLLQGKLSQDVMSIVTARDGGLFPKPKEIKMSCSCPDYAHLCKHLAAVLYGIGARLDQQPELLFLLRKVDHLELITAAGQQATAPKSSSKKKTIATDSLSEIFGIDLESSSSEPAAPADEPKPKQRSGKTPRAAKRKPVSPGSEVRMANKATNKGTRAAVIEKIKQKALARAKSAPSLAEKAKPAAKRKPAAKARGKASRPPK